jgi:ferrous iron transport protein B
LKIGLIGNPNVGKSLIFSLLTGIGVEVSNYPGTTVDIMSGTSCANKQKIVVSDLPGTYSLDGESNEEKLVRNLLLSHEYDSYVLVLDASHLERNLYQLLQFIEYQVPAIVVLNMADEAEKTGLYIDTKCLSHILGMPVILTDATIGRHISDIIPLTLTESKPGIYQVPYDHHIEAAIRTLSRITGSSRNEALLALQGIGDDPDCLEAAATIAYEIEEEHRMSVSSILAGNRHHAASEIKKSVISTGLVKTPDKRSYDSFLMRPFPGFLIMGAILISMLLVVFFIGSFFEEMIVSAFNLVALEPLKQASISPLLYEILFSFIIAIQAGLGIAFPFVFTFYVLISIIEDTGYMSRVAFLADRVMHRFGLHGQAIIPMVLGLGCNVPAIMAIRQIGNKRERHIAAFLITMVPCSARTVIISGMVAVFVGIPAAFSIYFIILILIFLTGIILSRITPGNQLGMVFEVPPLRTPSLKMVFTRAWIHIREFLVIAMPLLIGSSIVLGLMGYYGILSVIESITAPFMTGVLGLPSFASTALLFGILRKEMAFETLIVLAGSASLTTVMTKLEIYIFALVSTLFVPCISTIAVLYREQGVKTSIIITLYTVALGVFVGALVHGISNLIR